jgi:hypothetical protein
MYICILTHCCHTVCMCSANALQGVFNVKVRTRIVHRRAMLVPRRVETVDEELCVLKNLARGRGNSDARCTVVVHEAQMRGVVGKRVYSISKTVCGLSASAMSDHSTAFCSRHQKICKAGASFIIIYGTDTLSIAATGGEPGLPYVLT